MSTSKRNRYHHGDLREALTTLAMEVIETEGPEGLTLRGLAERAGVSGMAPYRHFVDKAALLEAVARQGFAALREEMRGVDDANDPKRALIAFGVVYVRFACARPGLFRLMFGGAPPTPDAGLGDDPQTLFGLFTARIADIAPPSERSRAFFACWAMVHGLASLLVSGRIRGPAPAPEDLARQLAQIVLAGLQASGEI
jgi:AcrR family transcriptional regulator